MQSMGTYLHLLHYSQLFKSCKLVDILRLLFWSPVSIDFLFLFFPFWSCSEHNALHFLIINFWIYIHKDPHISFCSFFLTGIHHSMSWVCTHTQKFFSTSPTLLSCKWLNLALILDAKSFTIDFECKSFACVVGSGTATNAYQHQDIMLAVCVNGLRNGTWICLFDDCRKTDNCLIPGPFPLLTNLTKLEIMCVIFSPSCSTRPFESRKLQMC